MHVLCIIAAGVVYIRVGCLSGLLEWVAWVLGDQVYTTQTSDIISCNHARTVLRLARSTAESARVLSFLVGEGRTARTHAESNISLEFRSF